VPEPSPGNLDGHPADPAVARPADAEFMLRVAALVWSWRESCQGSDLLAASELSPAEELEPIGEGGSEADALQAVELSNLVEASIRLVLGSIAAFLFDRKDLLVGELPSLELTFDALPKSWRQGRTVPDRCGLEPSRKACIDALWRHTLVRQEPEDPVRGPGAFLYERALLPLQRSSVLVGHPGTWTTLQTSFSPRASRSNIVSSL